MLDLHAVFERLYSGVEKLRLHVSIILKLRIGGVTVNMDSIKLGLPSHYLIVKKDSPVTINS